MEQLVIFGATGDLCKRKLISSLYELHVGGLLPKDFRIVGASRRELTTAQWLEHLGDYPEDFTKLLVYQSCNLIEHWTLHDLPKAEKSTFFLSVPPDKYATAITSLKRARLVDDAENTKVIIEKPFGYDLESAEKLQEVVASHLREKQIYRIDHYLGKSTVQNIVATRFSNLLLEPLWSRDYIEEVQIFAAESIGCEGRFQYYETAGVVRDMLQNHMLQILALIAMEAPCRLDAKEIRREKVKVLSATRLGRQFLTGQYGGYKTEKGVSDDSATPTFVAGDMYIDNWRWKGVPFHFLTGKKLPLRCCEVVIKLRQPTLQLFPGHTHSDRIVIRLQPDPHFDIRIDIKSPGMENKVQHATLTNNYPVDGASEGYSKLLYEALMDDQSNFVHSEEVLESWRIVADLLCVGEHCPVRTAPYPYLEGEWGPVEVNELTHWDFPK